MIYKEMTIRMTVDFSSQTMEARRSCFDIINLLKENKKST